MGDVSHPEWPELCALTQARGISTSAVVVQDVAGSASRYVESMGGDVAPLSQLPDIDGLAAVLYTSGTTGTAKGVMLSHANLSANTASIVEYLQLDAGERGIAILPLQFAYGNSQLHTHLAVGAELLIEESFAYPHAVLQRMADEGVTGFSGVPSTFSLMLSRCDLSSFELRKLRYVTQAGGPMSVADLGRLKSALPGVQLFVMYGQTEATARLSFLPPSRIDDKAGSVGVAIPEVELSVVRADGSRAAAREVGEIVARGPNIMLGYLGDPVATSVALRGGWLHTGDAGHFDDDGFLFVDGRSSEMIKVGAFRFSPYEVEEVIASIQGVADVAVAAVPDEFLGNAVKAVIVRKSGEELDVLRIKAHCRRHLATYKVPKHVEFVNSLPRTTTGKVQRSLIV
jgi:acyl-CoA synthetase (AMP-forming)/AMP-acid ligase II